MDVPTKHSPKTENVFAVVKHTHASDKVISAFCPMKSDRSLPDQYVNPFKEFESEFEKAHSVLRQNAEVINGLSFRPPLDFTNIQIVKKR